jgi:hypothetical protein
MLFDRYAGIVRNLLAKARELIEKSGFAGIRRTNECYERGTVRLAGAQCRGIKTCGLAVCS